MMTTDGMCRDCVQCESLSSSVQVIKALYRGTSRRQKSAYPNIWHDIQVEAVVRSESPVQPTNVMVMADIIKNRKGHIKHVLLDDFAETRIVDFDI